MLRQKKLPWVAFKEGALGARGLGTPPFLREEEKPRHKVGAGASVAWGVCSGRLVQGMTGLSLCHRFLPFEQPVGVLKILKA